MLAHAKELLLMSQPVPFAYDRASGQFLAGDTPIGEEPVYPDRGDEYALTIDDIDTMLLQEPLIQTPVRLISLPRFNDYIQANWSDDLSREVIDVMASNMPSPAELRTPSGDQLGFRAQKIDRELGRIVLQVPGMCTCIGPDATTPIWGSRMWDEEIFNYTLHNVDSPQQQTALLAGLGHLAFKAR